MQDYVQFFLDFLVSHGLKNTPQRRLIVDVFMKTDDHLSMEELYGVLRTVDDSVGHATVYRTLKLLCEAGLARELNFGDGITRYEPAIDKAHHDHLICRSCGKNIEVVDEAIEILQEKLAELHGFKLTSHRMYLYGLCDVCVKDKKKHGIEEDAGLKKPRNFSMV